ncbi:MAG TPA: SusC/RagA family TonB-linked outer membrane protein [Gemmatimonadales bacterium]|nr:SusC/RagA family TonB-linked outer membrane protein [Gemmatimonadales bacterium]
MSRFIVGIAAALMLFLPQVAHSQDRSITGRVTIQGTTLGLEGASVVVPSSPGVGTVTGNDGRFTLRLPAGDVAVTVRALGYKQQQVTVSASQATLDVALERDALQLEGLVITGQATSISRQNLATSVAVVNAEDLTRAPSASLEGALQGKIPGASINLNSGAPGGGGQIQIRGVTSILGSGEPLFVVDGVIISNAAIQGGMRTITSSGSNQDDPANRLADIDPSLIESIEVLKGAAASAIYGSKATNGVIVIKTKRGEAGRPRYALSQSFGMSNASKLLGSRRFETADKLVDAFVGPLAPGATPEEIAAHNAAAAVYRDNYESPYFDYQDALFGRTAPMFETNFSVTGGSEATKYFLAASHKEEDGIMRNTGAMRQNVRLNLDQIVSDKITANVSTAFIRSGNDRGITGNNNTSSVSPLYLFAYSPAVMNLDTQDAAGNYPENPFVGGGPRSSNPFQTMAHVRNHSDVYRWIGSGRLDVTAFTAAEHDVILSAQGGLDWFQQADDIYSPNFLQYEPANGRLGTAQEQTTRSRQINASLNAVWKYTPSPGGFLSFISSATTSGGLQLEERDFNRYGVLAENLIPGMDNIDQGRTAPFQNRSAIRDQAFYGQEELLAFDNRLFVTVGARAERSSVNGDREKLYVYPKASGSFRFPEVAKGVDELKVRAAIGRSGNQPRYGDRDLVLTASTQIGGQNSLRAANTLGNPDIRPETMTEQEYGIDASFLRSRLALEVTYFNRTVTDLLLTAPLPNSSGLTQQIINGGELSSKGYEIAVSATPISNDWLDWRSNTSFYKVKQKIEELPVPTFRSPSTGFGSAYGDAYLTEGYSTTAIWGNKRFEDGTVRLSPIGDATPDFTMQFANNFLVNAFTFNVLVDWTNGGVRSNLTQNLFDEGKNSWDFDHAAPNGDPRPLGQYRYEEWRNGQNAGMYLQDAGFVKLREISVSYDVPQSLTSRLGGSISNLRLSLAGRNLHTWTDYWGMDPEASNFGSNNVARIVDLGQYPPSRSFHFNISMGF